ncbi:MAG: hypothetical protein ABL886_17320, partial [Rhodoglobus sp.]
MTTLTALLDHLYEAIVPFEPAMVGPWTITASRGAETALITVDGPASVFAVPLIETLPRSCFAAVLSVHVFDCVPLNVV